MFNARIVHMENLEEAVEEVRKIGVDEAAVPWLAAKAVHITVKLENLTPYAANIIKQEMLGKGGDAAVHKGTVNCSVEKTDVLIMGTLSQFERLIGKLEMQSVTLRQIGEELKAVIDTLKGKRRGSFACGSYRLPIGEKTYVMGILNTTPDSFSDGGLYYNRVDLAVERAKAMVAEGADIIDVGGESTRPGHVPVDPEEEMRRVVPVIEALAREIRVPISVDTSKALVAEAALKAGACIVNDVWGMQRDPEIARVAAKYGAGVIIMHNSLNTDYKDLMGDIISFLRKGIEIAEKAGIGRDRMAVDPGIGFGKTLKQNLEIMRRLRELSSLGLPVLLGTSRKSMIGNVLNLPVNDRLEGTAATVAIAIAGGADFVRVHDVKEMARVARMTDAMLRL